MTDDERAFLEAILEVGDRECGICYLVVPDEIDFIRHLRDGHRAGPLGAVMAERFARLKRSEERA